MNEAVEKLLVKQANKTLLPIGTIMNRIGNCLYRLSDSSDGLTGVERSSTANMAMCSAECYRMQDAAEQHKSKHPRKKCAGWP
jgi:hypothetical protein